MSPTNPVQVPSQHDTANSTFGVIAAVLSLAISVMGDFFKPYIRWLPVGIAMIFALSYAVALAVQKRTERRRVHWFPVSCLVGLLLTLGIMAFAELNTPASKPDQGLLSKVPAVRSIQLKTLPLSAENREALLLTDSPSNRTPDPALAPSRPAAENADQESITALQGSVNSHESMEKKELAAQNAFATVRNPESFRTILRILYSSDDAVLREMAVLRELKSLEGRRLPIIVTRKADTSNPDKLAAFLISSVIVIHSVDLNSSSFDGTFTAGHSAPLGGTVNTEGVDFSSTVMAGNAGVFGVQFRLSPGKNFILAGEARGVLGADYMTTDVEVVPF